MIPIAKDKEGRLSFKWSSLTDPKATRLRLAVFVVALSIISIVVMLCFKIMIDYPGMMSEVIAVVGIFLLVSAFIIIVVALYTIKERRAIGNDINSLHLREELYRLAIAHSSKHVMRFDVKSKTLWLEDDAFYGARAGTIIENVPDSMLEGTIISPESKADIRLFFDKILSGEKDGACVANVMNAAGKYGPHQINFTAIFDEEKNPAYAIITFDNISAITERELVYKRWRQTLETLPKKRYRLIEHNLSKDMVDNAEGSLFNAAYMDGIVQYDERMRSFVEELVFPEDAELFKPLMTREDLLKDFREGNLSLAFDFRLYDSNHEPRWTKLSMQLIEYPNSTEVKVFKMYEDIDTDKKKELALNFYSQQDSLTKLLNRRTFEETVAQIIGESKEETQHALLLFDIDHLKRLNDKLGHAAGDTALVMFANNLRLIFDKNAVIARLGGDEFFILMKDIPSENAVSDCARQVNAALKKAGDSEINISCSIGIALYPRDGNTLETLYKNADEALYRVKDKGRRSYSFFSFQGDPTNRSGSSSKEKEAETSSCSLFKTEEDLRYRKIIELSKIAVIEVDMETNQFLYDTKISSCLSGQFDGRSFWVVLSADEVAEPAAILAMQDLVKKLIKEKNRDLAFMDVHLKNSEGERRNFHMKAMKVRDNQGATSKVLITFEEAQENLN